MLQYGVRCVGVGIIGLLIGLIGWQTAGADPLIPPFDLKDQTIIAEGAQLFRQNCTGYCHGKEGRLSRAPKLRGRHFEIDYLHAKISYGTPPMPAYQSVLPAADIWKLIAYIVSLAEAKDE